MNMGLRREIPLLLPMAILIGLGWVMVFSTAAALSLHRSESDVFHHLQRQMMATGLGAIGIIAILRIPLDRIERLSPVLLAVASMLMLAVFIPGVGKRVFGATRWIDLGRISFQPVETLKLAVVLSFAWLLARERPGSSWNLRSWLRLAALAMLAMILPVLQRDFGSAILMLFLGAVLIWLAGARLTHLAGFGVLGAAAAWCALVSEPYRLKRIKMFLATWGGDGAAYQTKQALIALGSGKLLGVGPGESAQKLFYLPSAHADFIFAIIGEELGFVGAGMTLFLYMLLLREGLAMAQDADGRFPRLLASGMILLIFFQALWHIAVVLVLVPTKGLALPFVSYGGSSLLASMLAIGVVMRCSAQSSSAGNTARAGALTSGDAAFQPAETERRRWAES